MGAADAAQVASAAFTALAALAALLTVRQGRHETRIAREALEVETQPLITDVPRGVYIEEREWHNLDGSISMRRHDRSEVSVGVYNSDRGQEPEPVCLISVPVRNVGNGPARIEQVTFVSSGQSAPGWVENPVLPSGEMTRVGLEALPNDPNVGVAEDMAMALEDFVVIVAYADAGGRPREAMSLSVTNGQHPHVSGRRWAASAEALAN
jgi:hypothetical protein